MVEEGRSFVRVAPLTVFIMTGEKLGKPYVISGARGRSLSIILRHHSSARYLVAVFFTTAGADVWDRDPEEWLAGCPIWEAKAISANRWTTLTYDLARTPCWKHEDIVAVFLLLTTTADPRSDVVERWWSRADYIDIGRIETTEKPK
jgi:hypothetical protein